VIDVKIELRQTAMGWEQIDCSAELRGEQVTVLDVPARVDEIFPSKDIAIATLKERVTFELQQHHRHESGDDVNWLITIHPEAPTS
jgi:hypothetical protein